MKTICYKTKCFLKNGNTLKNNKKVIGYTIDDLNISSDNADR